MDAKARKKISQQERYRRIVLQPVVGYATGDVVVGHLHLFDDQMHGTCPFEMVFQSFGDFPTWIGVNGTKGTEACDENNRGSWLVIHGAYVSSRICR